MNITDNLKWRYAVKKYNTACKIPNQEIELLKEAVNLSASSYGLQPYKILIISDPKVRRELSEASWGQAQVSEASHLFLFCSRLEVSNDDIDSYFQLRANINSLDMDESKEYSEIMKAQLATMTPEQMAVWTSKQTYIAVGTLLAAAAELKIDSTPMEGFEKEKYDAILGLKEKGLTSSVMVAVGYRDPKDPFQTFKKVRKSLDDIFVAI